MGLLLEPGGHYHIFNRANGNERIFLEDENYYFFLEKYKFYISPFVDTYCYCLMPNHFHFLISIKDDKEILAALALHLNLQGLNSKSSLIRDLDLEGFSPPAPAQIEKILSNQFSKFFNSYAKAFNKQNHRKGSLFMKNFKRKKVVTEEYFKKLVHYIHHNPVEAGICKSPKDYSHSSYQFILKGEENFMCKKELLRWFGDIDGFIEFHQLKAIQLHQNQRPH